VDSAYCCTVVKSNIVFGAHQRRLHRFLITAIQTELIWLSNGIEKERPYLSPCSCEFISTHPFPPLLAVRSSGRAQRDAVPIRTQAMASVKLSTQATGLVIERRASSFEGASASRHRVGRRTEERTICLGLQSRMNCHENLEEGNLQNVGGLRLLNRFRLQGN